MATPTVRTCLSFAYVANDSRCSVVARQLRFRHTCDLMVFLYFVCIDDGHTYDSLIVSLIVISVNVLFTRLFKIIIKWPPRNKLLFYLIRSWQKVNFLKITNYNTLICNSDYSFFDFQDTVSQGAYYFLSWQYPY